MTDHIAFLIDCVRKECIFLLEKELHTATNYQVIHLQERARGRGSLFPGHYCPKDGDVPALGIPTAPCHCYMVWVGVWVSGVGRKAGLVGALGPFCRRGADWRYTVVSPFVLGSISLSHLSHSFPGLDIALCRNGHP